MAINTQDLGSAKQLQVFVKLESTFGTLAAFASTDALAPLGVPKAEQGLSFTDSKEVVYSRSLAQRFRDATGAGKWSFQSYIRPSGAAGTPPQESALIESVLGTKAIVASTSVTYTPAFALPSLSLGFMIGHETVFLAGCLVEEAKLDLQTKDGTQWSWSGLYQSQCIAGTALTVSGSTTSLIKLETGAARRFDVGARVQVGANNNAGAGYSITATDAAADTITISPALGVAPSTGVTVKGFLPTPTLAGAPLANRLGQLKMGGTALVWKSFSLSIKNKTQVLDTAGTSDYPEGILPDQRTVELSAKLYFIRAYADFFSRARNQVQSALQVVCGNVAGSIMTVNLPHSEFDSPQVSADGVALAVDVAAKALPSTALEDEVNIVFT